MDFVDIGILCKLSNGLMGKSMFKLMIRQTYLNFKDGFTVHVYNL